MGCYDTLKDIMVGDKVLLIKSPTWGVKTCKIVEVSKVNKNTFRIKNSNNLYSKINGLVVNNIYSSGVVEPYDEDKYKKLCLEEEKRIKRNKLIALISNTRFNELSTEQLEQIDEIINKPHRLL